jgi:hypothetical protein
VVGLEGQISSANHSVWHNISIEHFPLLSILTCVKSLRTLLTLLLVAVWPLATSHCSLEQLPGLAFLACADEAAAAPHQDNDCETDTCASVESGLYKTEDHPTVPTPPLISSELLTTVLLATELSTRETAVYFNSAPPELSRLWQFSLRTALPPRAPSLAS